MRVLVTGGAGYIGSHTVRELLDQGHEVVVLDNLSKGHAWAVDRRASFTEGLIEDSSKVVALCRQHQIEAVVHFAAFIEVSESVADPAKYYQNNVTNALALLHSVRQAGVQKFVFSLTAAVYGEPSHVPILETAPRQPVNPYGRSKMMVEMALEDFCRAYRFGFTSLRYFNVAGAHPSGEIGEAHEPETHLLPRILMSAKNHEAVKVFGQDYPTADGTCIRDYVHVVDLARAHVLALEKQGPGIGTTYNLGSEKGFSVLEVLRACEKVVGHKIEIQHHARRPGDPAILVADSQKIRRELGWRPEYPDLETIVKHAWAWHTKKS